MSPFEDHARLILARVVARQSAAHAAFGANILQRCTGSSLPASLFFLPFSFLFLFLRFFSSFSFSLLSSAEQHARNGRSLFCSSLYTRDTNATERRKGDAHIAVKVNEKKGGRVRPDVSQSLREDHLENCCLSSSTEIVAPFGSCSTPYRRSSASQSQQATVSR